MSEKIEPQIRCTCCGGTGKYNPLTGPAEPCGTCKGEGVIPNPALKPVETKFNDTPDTLMRSFESGLGKKQPQKFYMVSTPGDRSSKLQEFIKQYQDVRIQMTDELLGRPFLSEKMPDGNQRREEAHKALISAAQFAGRTNLTLIEQYEAVRNLMIAKRNYMTAKTESFAELYGGGIQKNDVAMVYREGHGWVRASDPRLATPADYMENLKKMNYGERYQSESRIHRKGFESGDISLKFSVPPDLHASMEKVEAAFKTLTKTLIDLGIKIEAGAALIGRAVRALDPGSPSFLPYLSERCVPGKGMVNIQEYAAADAQATSSLWNSFRDKYLAQDKLVKPQFKIDPSDVFDESSIMLPVFHKDDPRVAMMEKVMQMQTDRALRSSPPLYYDPESGAITPCPETGRRINSQSFRLPHGRETSSSEPSPGAERLP